MQDLQPLTWPAIGGLEWRSTPPARRRGVGVCVARRVVGCPAGLRRPGVPAPHSGLPFQMSET